MYGCKYNQQFSLFNLTSNLGVYYFSDTMLWTMTNKETLKHTVLNFRSGWLDTASSYNIIAKTKNSKGGRITLQLELSGMAWGEDWRTNRMW